MKKYKVQEDFKGSPDGMVVLDFEKDELVEHSGLGDDLVVTALKAKLIKPTRTKK